MMRAMDTLREQLILLIEGHGAHMPLDEAVADFPETANLGVEGI